MSTNVIVGYDGSLAANTAIAAGAMLFPQAHAWVAYIWMPPFASARLRRRLRAVARDADDLIKLVEQEGEREAGAIANAGVALATAAEWDAEPLVKRTIGSDGLRLAQLAEKLHTDVVIVGARGLNGTDAVLGSVSDLAVHYATVPALVVPNPLLTNEFTALSGGPVVVGYDGSAGAENAIEKARHLFPERRLVLAAADCEGSGEMPAGPSAAGLEMLTPKVSSRLGSRAGAIADALIACADRENAALLVVGSRGRSVTSEMVLGSVARAAVHRSHRPVLVVHS